MRERGSPTVGESCPAESIFLPVSYIRAYGTVSNPEATIHGPLSLPPENNQKELNETTKPTWNLWYMEVVRFEHLLFLEFQTLFVKGIASRQHERAGRK